ncbi:hypothetical protein PTKIN_Ptkin07bG0041800 [Pterospermum kingtungense]
MAGTDPSKNLMSLIRDFATEKSQGERRVIGLKKQIEDLRSEMEAANSELEEAKRLKETTEQELKAVEFQLALNEASIEALEARISLIQDEISTVGSEVEELKVLKRPLFDEFISQMVEFNAKIRKFQETIAAVFENKNTVGNASEGHKFVEKEVTAIASRRIEDELAHIVSQIAKEEEEYLAEQNIQKQTCELEKASASLSEELQKRCICPNCHSVNVEALGGILQENEAN